MNRKPLTPKGLERVKALCLRPEQEREDWFVLIALIAKAQGRSRDFIERLWREYDEAKSQGQQHAWKLQKQQELALQSSDKAWEESAAKYTQEASHDSP